MTAIEWTDVVWNPVRGCSPVSPGCAHCYAAAFARRFSREDLPYHGLVTTNGKWTGQVRFEQDRLGLPLKWQTPHRVFVNSMSDLFHSAVTDEQIASVLAVVVACPRHTFQILTKRVERMASLLTSERFLDLVDAKGEELAGRIGACHCNEGEPWPKVNLHLVASCEDQRRLEERGPHLVKSPAVVRGVSLEPLLGPIDLTDVLWVGDEGGWEYAGDRRGWLDWVIVGPETGPGARPCRWVWIESIVDQCRRAGVPCFVKALPIGSSVSKDPACWPAEFRVRMFPGDRW